MAKNTLLMYIRMLVLIVVQLYTVPILLKALGVEDYGIYNVVGGFVTMFTFVNGSLVSGCQRFMAYAIGQKDNKTLKQVFETSFFVFIVLALLLFILIEVIGIWFLNTKMNIPAERLTAANWVLQLSILSLMFSICYTPFHASVIAHEKMSVFAYTSIFEGFYKLGIAVFLPLFLTDKMIVYAILMLFSSLLVGGVYFFYSRSHFEESNNLKFRLNKKYLKSITSYAGWNVIGSIALMLRNHGLNIVLNMFFTPVINAAHTIASHLNGMFNQFANNIYIATRPQIVKKYAAKDYDDMWNITFRSSRYAFYLMTFMAVPSLIELETILNIWLHKVPSYTIPFTRMMVVSLMIETMTNQLIGVFQAANKIKFYQSVSSVVLLSVVPFSYMLLSINSNPVLPYLIYIVISFAYIISLMLIAKKKLNLNVCNYIKEVILRDLLISIPSTLLVLFIVNKINPSLYRVLLTFVISFLSIFGLIWTFGLDVIEHRAALKFANSKIKRLKFRT